MKAKRKPATKAKRRQTFSRKALVRELVEITERLDKQYWIVDAIAEVNRPRLDNTILMEHRFRTVFGLQLDAVLTGLKQVRDFAKAVSDAATRTVS